MNKNTNIFYHATKELTTDAFLTWVMYLLDSEEKYALYKQFFFDIVVLKPEDKGRSVSNIKVKRQEKDVDVLLSFTFVDTNEKAIVLFEDKTWTSHHNGQLKKYKTIYPNCYRYIYFKLAYINSQEKKEVLGYGYEIMTSSSIIEALNVINDIHPLISMYNAYVTDVFLNKSNSFEEELFVKRNFNVLWSGEAQKYLCDKITTEMASTGVPYLGIRNGTSFGRPWTQIDIAKKKSPIEERLFWRVDIRSGKFYIRLNQYGNPSKEQVNGKLNRLASLRTSMKEILKSFPDIKQGQVVNRGTKESEVVIFFLENNNLNALIKALPSISAQIIETFKEQG